MSHGHRFLVVPFDNRMSTSILATAQVWARAQPSMLVLESKQILGVTKWQTRSAHSSAETERQNPGGLLEFLAPAVEPTALPQICNAERHGQSNLNVNDRG